MSKYLLLLVIWVATGGFLLVGCASKSKLTPTPTSTENKLTIDNFSIEQADGQGKLWWRLQAKKAIYTLDKKVARVTDLAGDLYQDDRVVLRLTAKTAEVEHDGQRVFLRGDVTARETRNKLVVSSQELEWRPTEDLLTIRQNVQATHPQLRATGERAQYISRQQRLEMFGKIVAWATTENVRLQTNHLLWQVDTQNLIGDQPVQVDRYQERQLTEHVTAQQMSFNLGTQIVQLRDRLRFNSLAQNVQVQARSGQWQVKNQVVELQDQIQFDAVKPPLNITAQRARWQISQQLVTASNALQIVHRQEQAIFTAAQGEIDLQKNVATLAGNAQGQATRNQAKLRADRLIWQIDNQQIVGKGHVYYQQSNPQLNFRGSTGIGKLQDQTVVVTGDGQQFVETEIVAPEASANP